MGQESFITSHILPISPSCWPAQAPWCTTLLRSNTGYFAPTQTSVLISMPNNVSAMLIWSALTQEIPPTKSCSDPCLSPNLAQSTCSTHSLHPLPSSKTQSTNAKTPVLTQLSTVMDMTSAWQTSYTNTLFLPLPDILLLVKTAWSFFTQEPDTVHHW